MGTNNRKRRGDPTRAHAPSGRAHIKDVWPDFRAERTTLCVHNKDAEWKFGEFRVPVPDKTIVVVSDFIPVLVALFGERPKSMKGDARGRRLIEPLLEVGFDDPIFADVIAALANDVKAANGARSNYNAWYEVKRDLLRLK